MALFDATESDWPRPVPNKTYYSMVNTLSVYSDFKGSDEFNCKWNTTPNENTTKFKLCRHGQASSANGTLQPMAGNLSQRQCSFSIVAPPEYQIEFSCSAINLTSYNSLFQLDGTTAILNHDALLETNLTYFSTGENEVFLTSILDKDDWIDCKWTTSRRVNKNNFKLCRDGEATSAIGTITPTGDVNVPSGGCWFVIEASADQRIEISCTAISSYLTIGGLMEFINAYVPVEPVIDEVYHSDSDNKIVVFSQSDWFSCKWAITPKENRTDVKLCLDFDARSPYGTITPLTFVSETAAKKCYFSIVAPPEKEVQISCSSIDIDTDSSLFYMEPIAEMLLTSYVTNRVYYSIGNSLSLYAKLNSLNDWFNCSWSMVPKPITTNFKLCRDRGATSANGTIQPLVENSDGYNWNKRFCLFDIQALPFQQIKFSCSFLNFGWNQFAIVGVLGGDESNPLLNHNYYSTNNNLHLEIGVYPGDWFSCKWTTVSNRNITA